MWTRRSWASVAGVGTLSTILPARAQPPGPRPLATHLEPSQVARNEVSVLTVRLTLTSAAPDLARPEVLCDDEVIVRPAGQQSSQLTRIINGKMSVELRYTFTYELASKKAGNYPIRAKAVVAGKVYQSQKAQVLKVSQQAPASPVTKAGDPIMLVPHIAPSTALYVGQLAFFQLELWSSSPDAPESVDRPGFRDFITEDFTPPRRRVVSYQGHRYDVQPIYYRAIFPQKVGELEIEGVELKMQPSGLGSIFGGRRRQRRRAYRVRGPATKVQVKPLPTRGQPPGFVASHVGQFKIRSEVDRPDLSVGDALNFSVEISGTGNLRLIELGDLPKIPGFRSYDPKRDEPEYSVVRDTVQGRVTWRYLLIADKAGTLKIPSITLSYFDPEQARYLKAETSPITLDVKNKQGVVPKAAPVDPQDPGVGVDPAAGQAPSEAGTEPDVAELMEFAPIQELDALADRKPLRPAFLTPSRYRWALGLAPLAVAASLAQKRIASVLTSPEKLRAKAEAKELMALLASTKPKSQDPDSLRAAWAGMGQLLQRLALWNAGPQGQGLARPELLAKMQSQGADQERVQAYRRWLDASDANRFGAASQDASQLDKAHSFAQQEIERRLADSSKESQA